MRRPDSFATFEVTSEDGSTRLIGCAGRFAMMLRELIAAGAEGCTSLSLAQSWAIRTSHYVFRLRRDHGLQISTEMEPHDGPFAGHHARYRLVDRVRVLGEDHSAAVVSTSPAPSFDRGAAA